MTKKNDLVIFILCVSVLFFSILALCVNRFWYRFPGLFYFDPAFLGFTGLLLFIYFGLKLQFNLSNNSSLLKIIKAAYIYGLILSLVLLATTAIQYTPFSPIDKKILKLEAFLHLDLKSSIAWLNQRAHLKSVVNFIYNSLAYQLIVVPLWVIFRKEFGVLYQFYFLALMSWFIGALVYYFFPTTAPASIIDSPYFVEAQRATGLKFWQVHHYIQPLTADGGMIAMPSFHVIWAWLCVYLLRPWPILFFLLGLTNIVLVSACVLLGWHYYLDVAGSMMTLSVAHFVFYVCHNKQSRYNVYNGIENDSTLYSA